MKETVKSFALELYKNKQEHAYAVTHSSLECVEVMRVGVTEGFF